MQHERQALAEMAEDEGQARKSVDGYRDTLPQRRADRRALSLLQRQAVATSDCWLQYVERKNRASGAPIPPREFGTQRHDEVVDVSAQRAGGET